MLRYTSAYRLRYFAASFALMVTARASTTGARILAHFLRGSPCVRLDPISPRRYPLVPSGFGGVTESAGGRAARPAFRWRRTYSRSEPLARCEPSSREREERV